MLSTYARTHKKTQLIPKQRRYTLQARHYLGMLHESALMKSSISSRLTNDFKKPNLIRQCIYLYEKEEEKESSARCILGGVYFLERRSPGSNNDNLRIKSFFFFLAELLLSVLLAMGCHRIATDLPPPPHKQPSLTWTHKDHVCFSFFRGGGCNKRDENRPVGENEQRWRHQEARRRVFIVNWRLLVKYLHRFFYVALIQAACRR